MQRDARRSARSQLVHWSALAEAGIDAVHWSTLGAHHAPDVEIMAYAKIDGFVVLTPDLQIGARPR